MGLQRAIADNVQGLAKVASEFQELQRERCGMDEEMLLSTKEIKQWIADGSNAHSNANIVDGPLENPPIVNSVTGRGPPSIQQEQYSGPPDSASALQTPG